LIFGALGFCRHFAWPRIRLQGLPVPGRLGEMRRAILLCSLFPALSASAVPVFIGTGGGESKGIYLTDFDPATGKLTDATLAAEYRSPGFLALHPSRPVILAVGQPKQAFQDRAGSVAAFSIAPDSSLTFLGEASSAGNNPCHLAIDATGRTVAVANYGDGKITTIRLSESGAPEKTVSVVANTGNGPNAQRQEGPHAHGAYFDMANRFLYVPDLGLDTVLAYRFDAATSEIEAHEPAGLLTAPGAGPRHMAFSPDERHAYVINELDQTVLVASHDASLGKFEAIQTAPTLPEDFKGNSTTSEIEVHPNGKFVYGSNRGHDSIAVYSRDAQSGRLAVVQFAPCGGKTPRHFKIDPSGKWLLCAHQDSNTISVLPIDPETGKLGEAASICLLFVP
jgi:6-phosphogluconolactonase